MISGSSVCRGTFGSPMGIKNATLPKGNHMKITDKHMTICENLGKPMKYIRILGNTEGTYEKLRKHIKHLQGPQ